MLHRRPKLFGMFASMRVHRVAPRYPPESSPENHNTLNVMKQIRLGVGEECKKVSQRFYKHGKGVQIIIGAFKF